MARDVPTAATTICGLTRYSRETDSNAAVASFPNCTWLNKIQDHPVIGLTVVAGSAITGFTFGEIAYYLESGIRYRGGATGLEVALAGVSLDHGHEERRTLVFRNYLRDHREVAVEYEQLKRMVAAGIATADPEAQQRYAMAKTDFVEQVVSRALSTGYPRGL